MSRTPSRHLFGLGLMTSQMYWPTFFWPFQGFRGGSGQLRSSDCG